jgi:hypothetical protein
VVRFVGLLPVAVVAAIVSYGHLSGLLAHYHESWLTAHIGPLAVDGLMVMASAALMATAPQRADAAPETVPVPVPVQVPAVEPEALAPAPRKPAQSTGRKSTAEAVAQLRAKYPELSQVAVAKRLKVTDRTVRKYWSDPTPEAA